MINIFGNLLFIALCVTFSISNQFVNSSSPFKSRSRTVIRTGSPQDFKPMPTWFRPSSDSQSKTSWNVFGQWFRQTKSKPLGKIVFIKSVDSVEDFWSFVTPVAIDSIDRADISLFRPGFEPDFSKFLSHETGYILSYNLESKSSTPSSAEPSPTRLSRNRAKKLQQGGMLSAKGVLTHYHHFDSIISAALAADFESTDPSTVLFSEILGFTFKKQFQYIFIQIFFDGTRIRHVAADEIIHNMVAASHPEFNLGVCRKYNLAGYSNKIMSTLSPRESPTKKSPSRIVTIVPNDDSDSDSEELVKGALSGEEQQGNGPQIQLEIIEESPDVKEQLEDLREVQERPIEEFFASNYSEDLENEALELNDLNQEAASEIESLSHNDEAVFIESTEVPMTMPSASLDDIIDYVAESSEEEDQFSSESSSSSSSMSASSIQSKLSPSAREFVPSNGPVLLAMPSLIPTSLPDLIPTKSLEDELLEFILNESAQVFKMGPADLFDHFVDVYRKLKAKSESEIQNY